MIFKLAPGDYTGVSITKATQNQTVEIHGSGSGVTNIQASAAWDATAGNVLYLRRFTSIKIKDCAVRFGAYGLYLRDVSSVELSNCRFYNLGLPGLTTTLTSQKRTRRPTGQHAERPARTGQTGGQCALGRSRK